MTTGQIYQGFDLRRKDYGKYTFSKWNWLWLWIYPTYVKYSEGYVLYYKQVWGGCIYLIKYEKYSEAPKTNIKGD